MKYKKNTILLLNIPTNYMKKEGKEKGDNCIIVV